MPTTGTTAPQLPPRLDLQQLRRDGVRVLKDEPSVLVEVLGAGDQRVVVKTYRNRGLRLLQTFGRRSRARREFDNLAAVERLALPLTRPLAWSERRRWGFARSSTLVTAFAAATRPLKSVLAELPAADPSRRRLARAIGAVLRKLHRGGVLWGTPMPRNLLLRGAPGAAELLLCDLPSAVQFRGPLPEHAAAIDLFDALFSPSRRRDFSRTDRLAGLCSYVAGDRQQARALWRRLSRRTRRSHRLHKNLVMGLRTYILGPMRATAPRTSPLAALPGDTDR